MRSPFLERLELGPLLADGAMGTMLYAAGVDYRRCFDALNLTDPALVQGIHRQYITAGAELIETNTYAANRFKLGLHGLEAQVRDINLRGVKLAREVREIAGEPVFVAGAVGPTGLALRSAALANPEDIAAAFRQQVDALLEGGVDLFIFETFSDLEELRLAVGAARAACDLPIIAQLTFNEDERTLSGQTPEEAVRVLEALGVNVIGTNCTVGPQGVLAVAERMARLTHLPISAFPNAGLPTVVEGRFLYLSTPQYFADYTRQFVESGVRLIGGCCGTTPQHVKAMREALASLAPVARPAPAARAVRVVETPPAYEDGQAPATEAPTELAAKLARGHYVISVELDPPKGINPAKVLQGAAMLKEAGADCINIGDSPMARVRMSCIAMGHLVQEQAGIEAIIHFTTRDRNLMAIQSELIGAHALGIRNVIALTGDPPRLGDYPNATGIWDVDSIGLISILKRLNEGKDYAGNSLARPTNFFVACAMTPQAPDRPKERERVRRKLDAGADIVMTQPLYTREEVEEALEYFGPVDVPLLLGVLPVQSHRHAEFLHNEVPGIFVPDHIRERMRQAGDKGLQVGLELTLEFLEEVKDLCAGIYIMPSFGRYEMAAEIIKMLRR